MQGTQHLLDLITLTLFPILSDVGIDVRNMSVRVGVSRIHPWSFDSSVLSCLYLYMFNYVLFTCIRASVSSS